MRWYVVLRGLKPGVYASLKEARAQVDGVSGSFMRSFSTKAEAEAFLAKARAREKVVALEGGKKEAASLGFVARTDGGFKEGVGYAAAVLMLPEGRVVGSGRLSFPRAKDAGEAELKALLLALTLAPRGSRVRVETDRVDLPVFWAREAPDPWGLTPLLKALAAALDLEVEVRRVPRKEVAKAHADAGRARVERERAKRDSAKLAAFLD